MEEQLYDQGMVAYNAGDYSTAADYFEEAAELGHVEAMHKLGTMYQWHWKDNIDKERAMNYYFAAIEKGNHINSMMCLGLLLEQSPYKSPKDALIWYKEAASFGSGDAMCVVGMAYSDGYNFPVDIKEAISWFTKATEVDFASGYYHLGRIYLEGLDGAKNDKKAFKLFLKAAERGCSMGQFEVGQAYEYGIGISPNKNEAMRWFRLSADQDFFMAQDKIKAYEGDDSVGSQFDLMLSLAESGTPSAQYFLALMYLRGTEIKQAIGTAFDWTLKSAQQGYAPAQGLVGGFYFNGEGTTQNYNEAFKWFRSGVENGEDADSVYGLALCYLFGKGVAKDKEKARGLLLNAIDLGHVDASRFFDNGQILKPLSEVNKDINAGQITGKIISEIIGNILSGNDE